MAFATLSGVFSSLININDILPTRLNV